MGIGDELWLTPLSPAAIGVVTGETRSEVRHALWVASRGLPGPARALAAALDTDVEGDPVVALALGAVSEEGFLEVDTGLVRLLETALGRAVEDRARARLLARLAHALLGRHRCSGQAPRTRGGRACPGPEQR